jgi:hypothetical protein
MGGKSDVHGIGFAVILERRHGMGVLTGIWMMAAQSGVVIQFISIKNHMHVLDHLLVCMAVRTRRDLL